MYAVGTVVITGTRGIGLEVASALHLLGYDTIMLGRAKVSGLAAVQRLQEERPDIPCEFYPVDLGSLDDISHVTSRIRSRVRSLDVLVNNAGVVSARRRLTREGWEETFGVNYLGHFALTGRLLPTLLASSNPRIVSVVSRHLSIGNWSLDDPHAETNYSPMASYGASKKALLSFGMLLDEASAAAASNLRSHVAHPGVAPTGIMDEAYGTGWVGAVSRKLQRVLGHRVTLAAASILAGVLDQGDRGSVWGPSGRGELRGEPGSSKIYAKRFSASDEQKLWRLSEALTDVVIPMGGAPRTEPLRSDRRETS